MKSEEFYLKLKDSLEKTTQFPSKYLFKFIVPTVKGKIEEVQEIFNHLGAVIDTKPSKNGNYTAVSVLVPMQSADQVIEKYKEASKVEGIVSL